MKEPFVQVSRRHFSLCIP